MALLDNKTLQKLVDRDQYERKHFDEYKETIFNNDKHRRKQLEKIIAADEIKTGVDYFNAALLYQHGDDVHSYTLAQEYAKLAIEKGYNRAKWLYAAATDRLLIHQGRKQRFGTQYSTATLHSDNPQKTRQVMKLSPYDKRTSDKTRAEYNVPPIKKALAQEKALTKRFYPNLKHYI